MSLSTETDPVATVLTILSDANAAAWTNTNGEPSRIARSGNYSPAEKEQYEHDAVYALAVGGVQKQPLDGTGDTKIETAQVEIEVNTLDGVAVAKGIAEDVESIIDTYWTDNETATQWTTVRVVDGNDYTHETFRDETIGRDATRNLTVELMRSKDV